MVLLSMDFWIAPFARKLFQDENGRIDLKKVEASYDRATLDELRDYPGLIWKVWAMEKNGHHGSGYYLFSDEHSAEVRKRYAERFYTFKGMFFVKCRLREVLESCSEATRAPLNLPANPPMTPEQEQAIMHPKLENPIRMMKHKKQLIADYEKGEMEK